MESGSTETGDFTFTLWVACYEIYNESVYDLLQTTSGPKSKKRATLRVCEDRAGSAYVRGETRLQCIILNLFYF
jgi:kinesin family protein 20